MNKKTTPKWGYLCGMVYKWIRYLLFLLDAESAHYFAMDTMRFFCQFGFARKILSAWFRPEKAAITPLWGIAFPNPVGLAAGFDKNARYLRELQTLGFGFIEIGTVTPLPQAGNEKPRLFRLPNDKALINRMGFNNDGLEAIAHRLKLWRGSEWALNKGVRLIIGGNIGKNKATPNEDAWKDYEKCFTGLYPYVDYFVVNVSSPNTPGLRELQEKNALQKILQHLIVLRASYPNYKPLLLKIAPDLTTEQIMDVIDLSMQVKLDGLVIANTTISREGLKTTTSQLQKIGPGGLSGKPLTGRSTELVRLVAEKTKGQIPIIASGGIFTGADAKEKIEAGASLVQVWTGFIYEGPAIAKKICNGWRSPISS